MPTGARGNPSVTEFGALVPPGLTVVISPLISLMKDQVDALTALGIPASFLNSSLTRKEQRHQELKRPPAAKLPAPLCGTGKIGKAWVFSVYFRHCRFSLIAVDESALCLPVGSMIHPS